MDKSTPITAITTELASILAAVRDLHARANQLDASTESERDEAEVLTANLAAVIDAIESTLDVSS